MTAQRLYSFLVVFLLMFLGTSFGQVKPGEFSAPTPSNTGRYVKIMSSEPDSFAGFTSSIKKSEKFSKNFSIKVIPASFYASHLGFVCKKELQLDKLTPIAFRFRLGSLDYVNYLEQKPNAINPQR